MSKNLAYTDSSLNKLLYRRACYYCDTSHDNLTSHKLYLSTLKWRCCKRVLGLEERKTLNLFFFFCTVQYVVTVYDYSCTCFLHHEKHAYIILNPLNPTFYVVKLGFTGAYISFLISPQKHKLWVLVRTASTRRF